MDKQARSGDGIVSDLEFNREKFLAAVRAKDPVIARTHGSDGLVALSEQYAPLHDSEHTEILLRMLLGGVAINTIIDTHNPGSMTRSDIKIILDESARRLIFKVYKDEYQALIASQPSNV